MIHLNKLSAKRTTILSALVEGCSIASTCRVYERLENAVMAAGIVSSPWDVVDLIHVTDEYEMTRSWPLAHVA
ncbi:MAG TPA: hypothetical protein VN181_09900 [Thermoanaerobaculia bacterium]|nr:hypothetical protein [Thermoanaerobaculia bacterium]